MNGQSSIQFPSYDSFNSHQGHHSHIQHMNQNSGQGQDGLGHGHAHNGQQHYRQSSQQQQQQQQQQQGQMGRGQVQLSLNGGYPLLPPLAQQPQPGPTSPYGYQAQGYQAGQQQNQSKLPSPSPSQGQSPSINHPNVNGNSGGQVSQGYHPGEAYTSRFQNNTGGLLSPNGTSGYRSPIVTTPTTGGINFGMPSPGGNNSNTGEQSIQYGIAGLGLGSPVPAHQILTTGQQGQGQAHGQGQGIGAWMEEVDAAGVSKQSHRGSNTSWLEASILQNPQNGQQQQNAHGGPSPPNGGNSGPGSFVENSTLLEASKNQGDWSKYDDQEQNGNLANKRNSLSQGNQNQNRAGKQQQQMDSPNNLAAERMIGKLVDDEVIPTAIVIKNIPFAVQKETLLAIIESLQAPLPYAFNYHHDNGVFRGLAFANFRHPHEADAVVVALNGYDISGRKLRVEYKKVLQAGEKERIEREKAIKRMRSLQFDRGQLTGVSFNGQPSPRGNPPPSATFGSQQRQQTWAQPSNPNASGNQQSALNGLSASLLANMTPQQLQSLAAGLPGGQPQQALFNLVQQGQLLTPPLTSQSQGGESMRDNKSGNPDSAIAAGSMQAMQQQHMQQLQAQQNIDRLPSPALSIGAGSHHSSNGQGGISPSLINGNFNHNPNMPSNMSSTGSQVGYNEVDFNDPVVLDIFSRALMFKEDRMRDDFSFSRNLSVKDRRAVHAVGEKLGLHHYSTGEGSDRHVILSKVDPGRNNPSKVLSRQTGRIQSMAAQSGSYLSPYSSPPETDSRPESPGLRIKKSMPNMTLLNGPTVSRDPHRLLNKRSSGNLRDYATISGGQQSRRPFASHTGATGSSSFNNLFGNALGNGTFESSSPTSPSDPTLATQGANLPGLPGGFVRHPMGPTTETKGFSRPQLQGKIGGSGNSKAQNGVIGGQRGSGSAKGDGQSTASGSSTIEEEEQN